MMWWADLLIGFPALVIYLMIAFGVVMPFMITSAMGEVKGDLTAAGWARKRAAAEREAACFAVFWPFVLLVGVLLGAGHELYQLGRRRSPFTPAEVSALRREEKEEAAAYLRRLEAEDEAARKQQAERVAAGIREADETLKSLTECTRVNPVTGELPGIKYPIRFTGL